MAEKIKATTGKPVIILHGDKGGVGKSTYACVLADWMLKREIPAALVDGDTRNPDVSRMFADSMPTTQANLRIHEGWMDLVDFTMAHPDRAVVISLPAGIGEELKREGGRFLQTIKMLERPLIMFWVINRLPDSVNLLNEAMKVMEPGLTGKVVVKNLFFGEADKFSRWESSTTKQRFEQTGGVTITMPELHERTVDKLFADNDNIMPFSHAAVPVKEAQTSPHKLTPSENMELVTWSAENHKTLDGLRGLLAL
ncbi:P-loop NTPase [Paraburkholderia sp. Se-20369]|nr:P-loop NTPase [Paraburkholderia sp. Se-20369]